MQDFIYDSLCRLLDKLQNTPARNTKPFLELLALAESIGHYLHTCRAVPISSDDAQPIYSDYELLETFTLSRVFRLILENEISAERVLKLMKYNLNELGIIDGVIDRKIEALEIKKNKS